MKAKVIGTAIALVVILSVLAWAFDRALTMSGF